MLLKESKKKQKNDFPCSRIDILPRIYRQNVKEQTIILTYSLLSWPNNFHLNFMATTQKFRSSSLLLNFEVGTNENEL